MQPLDPKYKEELEELAVAIQESDELATYLEEEEEEDYQRLKELFEPKIGLLYERVAREFPLQLIDFEVLLLDIRYEGLFLPKVLGYSILRGEIDDNYKFVRPQQHFKNVLLAICESANFDILKKRIGQSIQIGFALSSDIWITNLINTLSNKRIRYFLQSQKLDKYRIWKERKVGYRRYIRQFANDHYQTAEFPATLGELKVLSQPLNNFLLFRLTLDETDNSSILPSLRSFIQNEELQGTEEYLKVLMLYLGFFENEERELQRAANYMNALRSSMPDFQQNWLEFQLEVHQSEVELTPNADLRIAGLIEKNENDHLYPYYQLVQKIHQEGYMNEKTQEAIKVFYDQHEGLSLINECVRRVVYRYFRQLVSNLEPTDYPAYFEITKTMALYIGIFRNQQFNQDLKELSMAFIKKCLKIYTDKRGKDYQDIKKFVSTTFQDLGFLKEKEIVELFKTRRKKKTVVKS